jgi:hypothetical protein
MDKNMGGIYTDTAVRELLAKVHELEQENEKLRELLTVAEETVELQSIVFSRQREVVIKNGWTGEIEGIPVDWGWFARKG